MRIRNLRRAALAACVALVGCSKPESNEDFFNRTAAPGVASGPQSYAAGSAGQTAPPADLGGAGDAAATPAAPAAPVAPTAPDEAPKS